MRQRAKGSGTGAKRSETGAKGNERGAKRSETGAKGRESRRDTDDA